MLSVITNIYNKKTKGSTLMELFTTTGKLKWFSLTTREFDVCTTGGRAHIDTILKFLPHTRQYGCIDILHCCSEKMYEITENIMKRPVYEDGVEMKFKSSLFWDVTRRKLQLISGVSGLSTGTILRAQQPILQDGTGRLKAVPERQ
jgi:hypothetical protein